MMKKSMPDLIERTSTEQNPAEMADAQAGDNPGGRLSTSGAFGHVLARWLVES
jgi:hypothetical protein